MKGTPMSVDEAPSNKKREIFTYKAPWTVYTMAWRRNTPTFQLAVGSFMEEYVNQIQILTLDRDANEGDGNFIKTAKFDHPYPATKVMFSPQKAAGNTDLLATSGDYLRLWDMDAEGQVTMKGLLNNNKHTGEPPVPHPRPLCP